MVVVGTATPTIPRWYQSSLNAKTYGLLERDVHTGKQWLKLID
jgi:hypothetical protein